MLTASLASRANKLVHVVEIDREGPCAAPRALHARGYSVERWPGVAAFTEASRLRVGECVVLDVGEADGTVLDLLSALNARNADMTLVVVAGRAEVPLAVRAMREGCVDFLLKPVDEAALVDAVDAAFRRTARSAPGQPASIAARKLQSLSTREQQVLRGLTNGLSNKQIALELGISPRTVEIHRANLMVKLEARTLSGALQMAFAVGFTGPVRLAEAG